MNKLERFRTDFVDAIRCGYQMIVVNVFSQDHRLFIKELETIADLYTAAVGGTGCAVGDWLPTIGTRFFVKKGEKYEDSKQLVKNTETPMGAFREMLDDNIPKQCLSAFRFITHALNTASDMRAFLCNCVSENQFSRQRKVGNNTVIYCRPPIIVHTSDEPDLSPQITSHAAVFDFPLMSIDQLKERFAWLAAEINRARSHGNPSSPLTAPDEQATHHIAKALLGVDDKNCTNFVYRSALRYSFADPEFVRDIQLQKDAMLRDSIAIKPVPFEDMRGESEVADMDNLLTWFRNRKVLFTPEAPNYKLPKLKFVLLAGVSGCGKTRVCGAIANILNMRMYRFDLTACKDKFVGQSEKMLDNALKTVEALAEGVVFIDEIDKAMSGSKSTDGASGNVQRGQAGQMLRWLDAHGTDIVVVGACNDLHDLPPELIARADIVWGVDLPSEEGRWEIIQILCRERDIDPEPYARYRDEILSACRDYTGRDIFFGIAEAKVLSMDNSGKMLKKGIPSVDQLKKGLASIIPTIKRDPIGVEKQRKVAHDFGYPVSSRGGKAASETQRMYQGQ